MGSVELAATAVGLKVAGSGLKLLSRQQNRQLAKTHRFFLK